jgi:hypothetical protein
MGMQSVLKQGKALSKMKKTDNNEMDLVLRGLAKGRRDDSSLDIGSSFRDGKQEGSAHLDADELNSFAEGLVPDLARLKYVEHLADCSNCRRLVVNLTQASGNLSASHVADKQSGPGFWQRLTAILSPQVLRYAAPTLVLTAVIAIGLLAWRQQRNQDFVAQHTQTETPQTNSAQPSSPLEPTNTSSRETASAPQATVESKSRTDSATGNSNPRPVQGEGAKTQGDSGMLARAPISTDGVPAPPPAALEPGASRTQPFFSPEPKPGTYASAQTVLTDKKNEAKEEQPADRLAQQRERDDASFKRSNEYEVRNAPKVGDVSGPRRAEAPMSASRAPLKSKKDSDSDEMRNISGKQFRRQGNVWIDSNYESSRATINVNRGSEQFRALVADEPGIGTIANRLGGEVIVVWKGKAYRIR